MEKEIINSEIIATLLSSEVQRSRRPWGKIFLSCSKFKYQTILGRIVAKLQ